MGVSTLRSLPGRSREPAPRGAARLLSRRTQPPVAQRRPSKRLAPLCRRKRLARGVTTPLALSTADGNS